MWTIDLIFLGSDIEPIMITNDKPHIEVGCLFDKSDFFVKYGAEWEVGAIYVYPNLHEVDVHLCLRNK